MIAKRTPATLILSFATLIMLSVPAVAQEVTATESATKSADVGTSGWFRVDTDSLGTQFWFGATHTVGGVDIASDIYVVGKFAEFDIGPSFSFGNLAITPMVGIGFNLETTNVESLIAPQLFTIWTPSKLHLESWIQGFVNSVFDDEGSDSLYTRNFALYKAGEAFAFGPQVEATLALNEAAGEGLTSLPFGLRTNIGYDKNNTLALFLGYETKSQDDVDNVVGRFTFIRSW